MLVCPLGISRYSSFRIRLTKGRSHGELFVCGLGANEALVGFELEIQSIDHLHSCKLETSFILCTTLHASRYYHKLLTSMCLSCISWLAVAWFRRQTSDRLH